MDASDNHISNNSQPSTNDRPWLWKKGQSGNPKGRPKGVTMKEYARQYLAAMTEEERETFMEGLPKELIWKMAEGNPESELKNDITGSLTVNTVSYKDNGDNSTPQV